MPRLSRGCLRCRQRKVRCDEGRPCCQRCIARNEVCIGYRDESDLIFRHETDKVIGSLSAEGGRQENSPPAWARAPHGIDAQLSPGLSETVLSGSGASNQHQKRPERQRSSSVGPNRGHGLLSPPATQVSLGSSPSPLPLSSSSAGEDSRFLPWLKAAARPPQAPPLSESDNYVIQAFFSKYTLLPYHFGSHHTVDSNERDGYQRASQGFLEFLPCTFEEVNVRGRLALRWAVQAAASADAASHASRHGISDETNAASSKGARLNLQQRALECYGKALSALSDSLGKVGKVPDDYDLMTVVVLDVFESLFLPDAVSRGCHAQGMSQILRRRGHEQFYDARGWSLFRLAHHRVQKQNLAFNLPPAAVSEELLDYLNEQMSFVKLEKDTNRIAQLCARGRSLRAQLNSDQSHQAGTSPTELLNLVREMQALDRDTVSWRSGPEWSYATLKSSDLQGDVVVLSAFPQSVQIHPDIWTAYEWNYHRCARILLHKQLIACLHRAATLTIEDRDDASNVASLLPPLEVESITLIRHLTTEILATVPQMLGDIDHAGQVRKAECSTPQCRAIGAYFLLWPMKILKGGDLSNIIAEEQRQSAAQVMERIRDYTGMRSLLGDASIIG